MKNATQRIQLYHFQMMNLQSYRFIANYCLNLTAFFATEVCILTLLGDHKTNQIKQI